MSTTDIIVITSVTIIMVLAVVASCVRVSGRASIAEDAAPVPVPRPVFPNEIQCFHHGDEPLYPTDYRLCFECGHVYRTEDELVRAHLEILRSLDEPPQEPDHHGETIYACPLCTHDF